MTIFFPFLPSKPTQYLLTNVIMKNGASAIVSLKLLVKFSLPNKKFSTGMRHSLSRRSIIGTEQNDNREVHTMCRNETRSSFACTYNE